MSERSSAAAASASFAALISSMRSAFWPSAFSISAASMFIFFAFLISCAAFMSERSSAAAASASFTCASFFACFFAFLTACFSSSTWRARRSASCCLFRRIRSAPMLATYSFLSSLSGVSGGNSKLTPCSMPNLCSCRIGSLHSSGSVYLWIPCPFLMLFSKTSCSVLGFTLVPPFGSSGAGTLSLNTGYALSVNAGIGMSLKTGVGMSLRFGSWLWSRFSLWAYAARAVAQASMMSGR